MTPTLRLGGLIKAIAIVLSLALPAALAISSADARVGGGSSSGSRGSRTFSAPPSTTTAPTAAQPFNRTFTQPSSPGASSSGGGFFNRAGGGFLNRGGLLGGLAAGFLGAGLFGLLFGGGLFSGLGGLSSIFGLLLQIALIVLVARLAMSWWQRRQMSQAAYAGPSGGPNGPVNTNNSNFGGMGFGMGSGSSTTPVQIEPADYEAFERLLVEMQGAYSNEDLNTLRSIATPEMVAYFAEDMQDNRGRNEVNKVSDTKLLQGDLAEAWREGDREYASVAMRFTMIDRYVDASNGRLVGGSDQPVEATEVWTFVRQRGGNWMLSAIQQTN